MFPLPLISVSHIHCLQICKKQSRLNSFFPLLHIFIPLKILFCYSAPAQSCPPALLNFKEVVTALKLMERAIKRTNDIKSICYLLDDFVCIWSVIPFKYFNLKYEFIQSSQHRS